MMLDTKQRTINNPIKLTGVGLHHGLNAELIKQTKILVLNFVELISIKTIIQQILKM